MNLVGLGVKVAQAGFWGQDSDMQELSGLLGLFDEPTPLALIRSLQPDVLVKGGDYAASTIVGADEITTWGGRVEIVPTVNGVSTTNTIQKMTARG